MTKASLETPSDPLRVLNNKDIHEMIGTFPTLLPKLAEKLVRRFIKATHISHDEGNKISGHYTVAFGCLQRILAAFFVDSVLHELFQRKHFLLDQRANANQNFAGICQKSKAWAKCTVTHGYPTVIRPGPRSLHFRGSENATIPIPRLPYR